MGDARDPEASIASAEAPFLVAGRESVETDVPAARGSPLSFHPTEVGGQQGAPGGDLGATSSGGVERVHFPGGSGGVGSGGSEHLGGPGGSGVRVPGGSGVVGLGELDRAIVAAVDAGHRGPSARADEFHSFNPSINGSGREREWSRA